MSTVKDKDFIVNISKLTKAVRQQGFGLILILDTEHDLEYGLYNDLTSVGETIEPSSTAYKIASRIFAQKPSPVEVAIAGTRQLEFQKGTKGVYTLTLNSAFTENEKIQINGNVFVCKNGADEKKNEFATGQVSSQVGALKSLLEKFENNFEITNTTNTIVFTQKIIGDGSIPVITLGKEKTSIAETHKAVLDKGLIPFLSQTTAKHSEYFFLVCTKNDSDTIVKLSEFIDTQDKMYFVTSQMLSAPKLVRSENTVIMYHNDTQAYVAEGLASYLTTAKVGGVTAKFKSINGVKEADISSTELSQLHKDNGFSYIDKYGILQTTEGKTTSGEYIDVVMGAYWIKFKMEEGLVYLSVNTGKIGFDNEGISKMIDVCNRVLKKAAIEQNIVLVSADGTPQYKIDYIPREDTDPNDVANRKYNGINWTAKLSGAIHKSTVSGILEY